MLSSLFEILASTLFVAIILQNIVAAVGNTDLHIHVDATKSIGVCYLHLYARCRNKILQKYHWK